MAINLSNPQPKQRWEAISPFVWPVKESQRLPRVTNDSDSCFSHVLEQRRCSRVFGALDLVSLSKFLYYSCRTKERDINNNGAVIERRPVVAAGGFHVVSCLINLPEKKQWYLYNPTKHSLDRLDLLLLKSVAGDARTFIQNADKAVLIWYIGDMTRLRSKYVNPDSLIWRDAGALLATQSLVAEWLHLSFCPLGLTGEAEARLISKQRELVGLGFALVGSLPS